MAKNKKTWKYTKELPDDEEIKRYVLRSHGYNPNESLDAFGYGKLGNGHVLKSDIKKLNWMKEKASAIIVIKQGEVDHWKKRWEKNEERCDISDQNVTNLFLENKELKSQLEAKATDYEEIREKHLRFVDRNTKLEELLEEKDKEMEELKEGWIVQVKSFQLQVETLAIELQEAKDEIERVNHIPEECICHCPKEKRNIIFTVHPFPDICSYCGKAATKIDQ